MGSEAQKLVPIIDLSKDTEKGGKEWNDLCKSVREACEKFGCFEVIYDKISSQLREQIFSITKELFELPLEIKEKNTNPKPYLAYSTPSPIRPLLESFGIGAASNLDSLKAFSQLLLSDPVAQHHFCQSFSNLIKHQNEIHDTIWSLVLDSYGIENTAESSISSKTIFRMLKYIPPPPNAENLGFYAHTDKTLCTILCEDQSSGLEIHDKETDEWIQLIPSPDSFIFVVGDPFVAWSNGKLHAVKHRVVMKGDKDRYTLANFIIPNDDAVIKPRKELIDENNPNKYKEFEFGEFMNFCCSNEVNLTIESGKQLDAFAGI